MSKVNVTKSIRDIGWDAISLSNKGFKGAVQLYKSNSGSQVALCFSMHEAFIVEDGQGLFGKDDLVEGIIQNKSFDVEESGSIDGVKIVAFEENGEVDFNEELLDTLGINDFSVRESLTTRLLELSKLDQMVDLPLG